MLCNFNIKKTSLSLLYQIPKFLFSSRKPILNNEDLKHFIELNQTIQIDGINLRANEIYPGPSIISRLNRILKEASEKENSYLHETSIKRCLNAFDLNPNDWEITFKEDSQINTNISTIYSNIGKNGKIMCLNYYHGGNNPFGFEHFKDNIFINKLYEIEPQLGIVDMDKLSEEAKNFKPNLIFIGGNAYPRDWDYENFRKIKKQVNCLLMCDISQIYGLISTNLLKNPFNYCDIVTLGSNILKNGIIFEKKKKNAIKKSINQMILSKKQYFPNKEILSIISNQMLEIKSNRYKNFSKQIINNSKVLSEYLLNEGNRLQSNGTDTHLVLWDLKPLGINGAQFKKTMSLVNIYLNRNSIAGDSNVKNPQGVLIGLYDATFRNIKEKDIEEIGRFLMNGCRITQKYSHFHGDHYVKLIEGDKDIPLLKKKVLEFVKKFPIYESKI